MKQRVLCFTCWQIFKMSEQLLQTNQYKTYQGVAMAATRGLLSSVSGDNFKSTIKIVITAINKLTNPI